MKKIMALLAFFLSFAAHAQKVTEKGLQGSWLLVSMSDEEVILYPEERRGELTEAGKEGLTAEQVKEEEASLAYDAADYADTLMSITGNALVLTTEDEVTMNGTFTINTEGTMLIITDEYGEESDAEISLKDKKLRLYIYADEAEYIFKKKE